MHSDLFQITSKIAILARSGRIKCARKLFDEMSHRDAVAWNAMLTGYSQLGLHQESLSLFRHMRISNTKPDHYSFTATLSACAGASELTHGVKIHALVIVSGFQSSLPVCNSLIDMYGKCLRPFSASKVFEDMQSRNEVTWCSLLFAHTNSCQFDSAHEVFHMIPKKVEIAWNILIASHARCGEVELCLNLFKEMRESLCQPDQWTLSALMNACSESSEFSYGCLVQGIIIKTGWSSAVEAKNSVLSFYARLGCPDDATKEFESFGTLTQVSWNAIIDAHMRVGDTQEAFLAFQRAPEKNIVSWTSMIAGYARNGNGDEALCFFVDMMRNCVQPDDFAFGAVLHACSSLAVLGHGKMVHGCIIHFGMNADVYVGNGLINMYAKCGDVEGSSRAFNEIPNKDVVSWNAMLFGFGLHGRAGQALWLYEQMVACGVKPDKVTFIGLLMTCSHLGLIEKGRFFFESMVSVYGICPEMDHVACMVDILGRGGFWAEATELADKYSVTDNAKSSSSEALLGACSAHWNVGVGAHLGEALKILEPQKEISYVVLSNLYCASGQWKEAEMIRKAMLDQGVKKMPGCSWIEVRNRVTAFVAGNHSHPYLGDICKILHFLQFEMRNPCFIGFEKRNFEITFFR
ncbi:pentatricopeptide repeat-containing protein At2g36980, mitochondrial [Quercus suber]|uniref:Pentatricopeptide repeat-containing protein n=1 Tax=Quercus suber TaxID=58331 RepID=A0AAW0MC30_QUESU